MEITQFLMPDLSKNIKENQTNLVEEALNMMVADHKDTLSYLLIALKKNEHKEDKKSKYIREEIIANIKFRIASIEFYKKIKEEVLPVQDEIGRAKLFFELTEEYRNKVESSLIRDSPQINYEENN